MAARGRGVFEGDAVEETDAEVVRAGPARVIISRQFPSKCMETRRRTHTALNGLVGLIATALTAFECPLISPIELPVSRLKLAPHAERPSPTTMSRFDSESQAMSLMRESGFESSLRV